jgi:hypothetical protein
MGWMCRYEEDREDRASTGRGLGIGEERRLVGFVSFSDFDGIEDMCLENGRLWF